MSRRILLEVISFLFMLLFLYTVASKWLHFEQFYKQMNLQPFDDKFTPLLVWGVPIAELICVVLLVFNKTRLMGLYMSTFLMILFTGYVGLVKIGYYEKVPCSCGGVINKFTWSQHLALNIFFLLLGIIGIWLQRRKPTSMNQIRMAHAQ